MVHRKKWTTKPPCIDALRPSLPVYPAFAEDLSADSQLVASLPVPVKLQIIMRKPTRGTLSGSCMSVISRRCITQTSGAKKLKRRLGISLTIVPPCYLSTHLLGIVLYSDSLYLGYHPSPRSTRLSPVRRQTRHMHVAVTSRLSFGT